jgi:hypothetical protein
MIRRKDPAAPAPDSRDPRSLASNPRLLLDNPGPSTRLEKIVHHAVSDTVCQHGNSAEYLVARIAPSPRQLRPLGNVIWQR